MECLKLRINIKHVVITYDIKDQDQKKKNIIVSTTDYQNIKV